MRSNVSLRLLDHRRRVRADIHQRRRNVLLGMVVAAATCAAAWWVATGPPMQVANVSISGYSQADQAKVVQAIQIAAAQGDALRLPVQSIRAAVQPMPWVEDVTVAHDWPRGVTVSVTQAIPAAVAVADGERWLVSTRGRVLDRQDEAVALPEVLVSSITRGEWLRGSRSAGLRLVLAISPDVRSSVRGLHVNPGGLLVGRLAQNGVELRFGPPTDLWRKGRSLDTLLANSETRQLMNRAEYVDLSTGDAPVFGGIETSQEPSSATLASDSAIE